MKHSIFVKKLVKFCYWIAYQAWQNYLKLFACRTMGAQVIVIAEDKVLLVKSCYRNFYCFPGGYRSRNESPLDNGLRELKEETGVELSEHQLELLFKREFSCGRSLCIDHIYIAYLTKEVASDQLLHDYEIEDVGFYDICRLQELDLECFVKEVFEKHLSAKLQIEKASTAI